MRNKKFMQWAIIAVWFLTIFLAGVEKMLVKYPNILVLYLLISSGVVAWLVQLLEKREQNNSQEG